MPVSPIEIDRQKRNRDAGIGTDRKGDENDAAPCLRSETE